MPISLRMSGPTGIFNSPGRDLALRLFWHHLRALCASQLRKQRVLELAALREATSFIEDSTHACGTGLGEQDEIPPN
jgi:hypothetical protein